MKYRNETEIRDQAIGRLSADFIIQLEVPGIHLIENAPIRIDMLCRPKPHLVERGFAAELIGVEFKLIDQTKGSNKFLNHLMWQSVSYGQSLFVVDGAMRRPTFIAVCFNKDELIDPSIYQTLLCFCQYGNVCELSWGGCHQWAFTTYGKSYWIQYADGTSRGNNVVASRKVGNCG